ncbi:hypothetical protein LTR53_007588 [Teratosphaeriaceae sp. CCFEE 6253]|nr:hypothetical protein LTR53_007588 [Teratosphaeriaceae sp. CCFEE 6253]
MPKRRTFNFKQFQSDSAPSGANRKDGSGDSPLATVNERLSELRKIETPEGLQKKRDLAASVNQPSVPPELRGILGLPDSAPPKPKTGFRPTREMRRTPGPAPPRSWLGYRPAEWERTLAARSGKGRRVGGAASDAERNRPKQLIRFKLLVNGRLDAEGPSGLQHLVLKRLAEQWELFDEDDFPTLIEIPLRLRLRLLSYLGAYGAPIDTAALQALTQGDEPLTQLDLSGLAGHGPLSIKKLARLFEAAKLASVPSATEDVAESWDVDETLENVLLPSLATTRFHTLTHLSLSHPPATAPWRDLLALSKHLPRVTHLSLAYWPRPTLTPNLATATVSSRHSPDVQAGGSHYYSTLDGDYAEAAAILRQLSHHLLCLQWLDLEGCMEGVLALGTLTIGVLPPESNDSTPSDSHAGWPSTQPSNIAIVAHTWKNLTYIRCAQGWLPSLTGLHNMDRSLTGSFKDLLARHAQHFPGPSPIDFHEIDKRKAGIWMDKEQTLLATGRRINNIRRLYGDYMWWTWLPPSLPGPVSSSSATHTDMSGVSDDDDPDGSYGPVYRPGRPVPLATSRALRQQNERVGRPRYRFSLFGRTTGPPAAEAPANAVDESHDDSDGWGNVRTRTHGAGIGLRIDDGSSEESEIQLAETREELSDADDLVQLDIDELDAGDEAARPASHVGSEIPEFQSQGSLPEQHWDSADPNSSASDRFLDGRNVENSQVRELLERLGAELGVAQMQLVAMRANLASARAITVRWSVFSFLVGGAGGALLHWWRGDPALWK